MDVNFYLPKQFEQPPCWQMVSMVYAKELGQGVATYKTITNSVREIARAFRLALHKGPEGLSPVDEPTDYAIVLMGRKPSIGFHHCGVWYQGSVLHALPEGNLYQDMASIRDTYGVMEFWARA